MLILLPNRTSARGVLPWAVLALGLALVGVNLAWMTFRHGPTASASASTAGAAREAAAAPAPPVVKGPGGLPSSVTLAEGKLKASAIATEKVRFVALSSELGVPGRIDANQDREVVVRPRVSGVIREVNVVLGRLVKKEERLAVLDSADIGTGRLNLRAKQRELATVRFEADWKKQVAENVAALIPLLGKRTEAAVIEKQFAGRPLGLFRSTLLDTYSQFDIAAHEEEKTTGLRRQNILGEHPVYVAAHTREGKQAIFEGTAEQSRFEAEQQSRVAAQQVHLAEGAVIDAAQRLRIMGVSANIEALLANPEALSTGRLADEDVTRYEITAPFDGTIITRSAVVSQKAEVNDPLFTIADLSTVWVTANIPESDFGLLPALQKGRVRVSATAYPGRSFDASLLSVGASVDPTTRTVPMLAETKNTDGLLKIGMFVRIILDTSVTSKGLSIPSAAVIEIEGVKGVFVPDSKDPKTFHFRPVKLDRAAGNLVVVASGLSVGDDVVTAGASLLKSELILQNEKEEE